jgi:hypothetical protein
MKNYVSQCSKASIALLLYSGVHNSSEPFFLLMPMERFLFVLQRVPLDLLVSWATTLTPFEINTLESLL